MVNIYIYIYIAGLLTFVQIAACIALQKGAENGLIGLVLKCISDYSANAVFPLVIAVTMFLGCQNLETPCGRKLIQTVGAATLGVYLFHDNVNFRGWLWQKAFQIIERIGIRPFAINAMLSVFAVFALGITVELLRASAMNYLLGFIRKNRLRE